ncbi:hypothetical protein F5882DRAFT_387230 [Hyaloscypha sp. PMI_1271]|nr:hypothetical protein F5882DRAFT_387230 [Hyaloscypha sp. PMI_1271]
MEDLNINSAATETKRASECIRPSRTISAPAAPVEYDLTQESLNTLNMASESSGPCAPSRRSVSRVEHTERIGGVPMKRSYARIGNSGGRPCSGPSIVASTQAPQDPPTVRSPVVPSPGISQTIGQSGNSQRSIRGEATVRGGRHPSQGNGANPGEEDGRKERERLNRAHQLSAGITLALLDLQQSLPPWDNTHRNVHNAYNENRTINPTVRFIDATEVFSRQNTGRLHRPLRPRLDSPLRTAKLQIKSNGTKDERHRFGDKW